MAKTILLADDSITIQKIVNLTFSGEGIEVVTVGNGDAAIKKVHEISPDLVLADIFMPGKNGYEVCEYIKGQPDAQRIPVILLVGAFEPFDSNEAARVKADGHLTKPFEIKVLISAVNSLISAAEEEKAEAGFSADGSAREETLPRSITLDTAGEIEVGAPVVVQHTAVSGSELQSELSSSTVAPAFFESELLATEGPVVDVEDEAEPSAAPIIVAGEAQTLTRTSSGVDDPDPLGLFTSESVTSVRLEDGPAPDSKELVVDIWESRSSSPGQVGVLPEAAEHRAPVPSAAPLAVLFHEPVHTEAPAPVSSSIPTNSAGRTTVVFAPSESALSSDHGTVPLTQGGPQAKKPAVAAQGDSAELVDIVVQRVMEKLSREVIEKIAWEVVPDLAEIIIKEQVETHFKASGTV